MKDVWKWLPESAFIPWLTFVGRSTRPFIHLTRWSPRCKSQLVPLLVLPSQFNMSYHQKFKPNSQLVPWLIFSRQPNKNQPVRRQGSAAGSGRDSPAICNQQLSIFQRRQSLTNNGICFAARTLTWGCEGFQVLWGKLWASPNKTRAKDKRIWEKTNT